MIACSICSRAGPSSDRSSNGGNGTGPESMSEATRSLRPRHEGADVTRSVCPYCAVGCGQLIFHRKGRVIAVEGDPQSPISEGHLCPKGADTFELLTHRRVNAREVSGAHSSAWQDLDLETAMDMIAERVWDSRDRHFREQGHQASTLMQCPSIAHLGGATLDNEENYLIKKLFAAGLGMVAISNQARI